MLPFILVYGSQKELRTWLFFSPQLIFDYFLPAALSLSKNNILDQPCQSDGVKKLTQKREYRLCQKAKERRIEEKKLKIYKSRF